ncbi:Abi-alpha family protein [Dyadobacter sp. LHD-138]|uniref:Abi-alpha family protein n=1 Tax=Dyadobacter sp. LHD-138 TaxID=3071413 RepID=UPI0027DEBEC9|nr:Abi-alpha family protein [Dyadobacter sp. LHD-138]MDQ6481709.1 Abi-alpha family protein [Dyadobacter sp. LHD-138]
MMQGKETPFPPEPHHWRIGIFNNILCIFMLHVSNGKMSEINIKSSTVEAGIDLVKGFLNKVIGPSADEFGLMMSDNLKMRRFKNQLKNLNRAQEICEEQNISTKQINLKALFPYLEGVSLEEDPHLQEMWANLFVNYVDSEKNLTLTVYPDVLRQLSTNEAKIIQYSLKNGPGSLYRFLDFNTGPYDGPMPYSDEEISNLMRLSLLEDEIQYKLPKLDPNGFGKDDIVVKKQLRYKITEFGKEFLKACERNS